MKCFLIIALNIEYTYNNFVLIHGERMQSSNFNYKYGFTLAEVLITLGIIGIVAAMTIPTLIKNTQDSEFKSAWKKAFSELSQADQQIITDNGGQDFTGQCSNFNNICLRNLFMEKLKSIKQCNNSITDGCVVGNSKFMDGTTVSFASLNINNNTWPAIITPSGWSILFRAHETNCLQPFPFECGYIQVDVNGLKPPNIAGRDIYFIGVVKTKLVPFGAQGDPYWNPDSDCAAGGTGVACSAKYLQQ